MRLPYAQMLMFDGSWAHQIDANFGVATRHLAVPSRVAPATKPLAEKVQAATDELECLKRATIFEWIDANKSGTTNYEEFLLYAEYCGAHWRHDAYVEAGLRFAFDEMDSHAHGELCKEEIAQLLVRVGLLRLSRSQASSSALKRRTGPALRLLTRAAESSMAFFASFQVLSRQTLLALRVVRLERPRGGLSEPQRDAVRRTMQEVAKFVPFLCVGCLPGGTVLVAGLAAACPSSLPLAFQNMFSRRNARDEIQASC